MENVRFYFPYFCLLIVNVSTPCGMLSRHFFVVERAAIGYRATLFGFVCKNNYLFYSMETGQPRPGL